MGKKKKKHPEQDKEKELLELRKLKTEIYESMTVIVGTIVTVLLAIITAVLEWIK